MQVDKNRYLHRLLMMFKVKLKMIHWRW